ncbi:MAG: CDP-diacylglycerol--serine O-phosphatidyltransferase [Proteobacteria bacterium]|nr:CDP-diacylglycerol--serine O-phosphatidyltransferase [Pseudomonadota bacterium]
MSILRYTVPNSFTALSLLLGVASIVTTQLGDLELAGWIIVWCALLDVMDGLSARLLKATSSFGAEFDSMADLVAFGVAPAVLVLNAGLQIGGVEYQSGQFWVLLAAIATFVLAGAMRLARFNLVSNEPSTGWFTGIPITATGGGMVSSLVLVLIHHEDVAAVLPLHLYFPILMFVLAILMISRLRFPKAMRRESNFINVFQILVIGGIYYCGITRTYPEYLLGIGVFLMIAGIIAGRITRDA